MLILQLYTGWAVQKVLWIIHLQKTSKESRVLRGPLPAQPSPGVFTSLLSVTPTFLAQRLYPDRTTCAGDPKLHNCELLSWAVQGWDSTSGSRIWPCLHPPIDLPWWTDLWSLWCHLKTRGTWLPQSPSRTEIFSMWFLVACFLGFMSALNCSEPKG